MLIGLTGRKRSGKSTIAASLVKHHHFTERSFADPLRAMTCQILGITARELDDVKETPVDWLDGVTPRRMMQTIGTEWGRDSIHPEIWVRALQRQIETLMADNIDIVISDVRFDNEATMIRSMGGIMFRVHRHGLPDDQHRSEAGVNPGLIDHNIFNNGGIDELRGTMKTLLHSQRLLSAARSII